MAYCSQCGAEMPDGARFCAKCGTPAAGTTIGEAAPGPSSTPPPATPTGSGTGWVLPALVVVALAVIGYLLLAPKPSVPTAPEGVAAVAGGEARPADAPATGTAVSAAVLDSAFNSDPAGAAMRYAGPVRVSGVIASMVQPGATPSLSMEGRTRFNFMVVNFPAGYRERLAPLAKGQFITVACDGAKSLGGTTILSGCLLG